MIFANLHQYPTAKAAKSPIERLRLQRLAAVNSGSAALSPVDKWGLMGFRRENQPDGHKLEPRS
jgi:hypothetical protein